MFCKSACSPCSAGYPTIQVDMQEFRQKEFVERFELGGGRFIEKHGANRLVVGAGSPEEADRIVEQWEREVVRRAEEAERLAKEQVEMARLEQAEQEARRRSEEQRRQRQQEEAERAKLEEQRRQEEELRRLEEERLQREEAEKARAQREDEERRLALKQEEDARKEALSRFYLQNGFTDKNDPRRGGCAICKASETYPLHVAAEQRNATIVEMLLKDGANATLKNSSGKTALQVAQKMNKAGSHDAVVRILGGEPKPRTGGA